MKANISARGYTNVILVLNMKRFVQEQDQARFERIRGREEFAKTLREIWPQKLNDQEKFITIQEDKRRRESSGEYEYRTSGICNRRFSIPYVGEIYISRLCLG